MALEFHELCAQDSAGSNPFRQLVLIKRAMHTVAQGMRRQEYHSRAVGTDDKLGWVLSFIRAAEKVNLRRMRECAKAYPHITSFIDPENPEARSSSSMWNLRDHALQRRTDYRDEVPTRRK